MLHELRSVSILVLKLAILADDSFSLMRKRYWKATMGKKRCMVENKTRFLEKNGSTLNHKSSDKLMGFPVQAAVTYWLPKLTLSH